MGFSNHVWSLYALTHCTHSHQFPYCPSNRLVAACPGRDVSEFITLILQPYKKSYMNVLDNSLLALLGFLLLLLVTFLYKSCHQ